jgi:hypothetical protein
MTEVADLKIILCDFCLKKIKNTEKKMELIELKLSEKEILYLRNSLWTQATIYPEQFKDCHELQYKLQTQFKKFIFEKDKSNLSFGGWI